MTRDVLAIIPTKDRLDLLQTAVGTLRQHCPDVGLRIVDAGTDGSVDWAEEHGYDVVRAPGATFAQAINAGANEHGLLGADALLFLNNDVVIEGDFLAPMLEVLDREINWAVVGARLLYPNGLIQHAGVGFDTDGNPYHLWHNGPGEHPEATRRRYLNAVTFACALVSAAAWRDVGPLDEQYVNAYEDIDWCLRARERGIQVVYEPAAVLTHLTAQTPGRFDKNAESLEHYRDVWLRSGRFYYVLGGWPFSYGGQ